MSRSRSTLARRGGAAHIARRGRERLAQGFWVVVFSEGTRVRPGERREYQVGGAWLAWRAARDRAGRPNAACSGRAMLSSSVPE